tara:strand:- start:28111 stop:29193 length:1083 start_codon:yes stop_codon:yes gene_type:complete
MNKQLSIYLDFIRLTAGLLVFISHVPGFAGGWLWQFAGMGHEAVVVFFVLSGFVISYVVYERKEGALKYTVSRLSRIYSVALPALLLTLLLYYLGVAITEDAYKDLHSSLNDPSWTIVSALLFLNQSWVASPVFSNLPYWSLSYEVLYYLFFGFLIYLKGIWRVSFLIISLALMGPSIILYLPVWLLGLLCFKLSVSQKISLGCSVILFLMSIIGFSLLSFDLVQQMINGFGLNFFGDWFYSLLLEPADYFLSDYLLSIFFALHIFSTARLLQEYKIFNSKLELIIRWAASHTFSIYLFHMPMLYFVSLLVPYDSYPVVNLLLCWLFVPFLIILLSTYTENKKHLYVLFFTKSFNRLGFK